MGIFVPISQSCDECIKIFSDLSINIASFAKAVSKRNFFSEIYGHAKGLSEFE